MSPYIPLVISTVTAVFGAVITFHPPEKRKHKVWCWVLFSALTGASVWVAVIQNSEQELEKLGLAAANLSAEDWRKKSDEWQAKSEHWQKQLDSKVDEVGLKLGLEDSRQRIFELQRQLIAQMIALNTKTAVQEFKQSRDTQMKMREERLEANRELLIRVEPRFSGVVDSVRGIIAEWLADYEKVLSRNPLTLEKVPPVALGSARDGHLEWANFNDTFEFRCQIRSAVVNDGKVTNGVTLNIFSKAGPGTQWEQLWTLQVSDSSVQIWNHKPNRFKYQPYQAESENPVADQKFMQAFYSSLNEVMNYIVLEGSSQSTPSAK